MYVLRFLVTVFFMVVGFNTKNVCFNSFGRWLVFNPQHGSIKWQNSIVKFAQFFHSVIHNTAFNLRTFFKMLVQRIQQLGECGSLLLAYKSFALSSIAPTQQEKKENHNVLSHFYRKVYFSTTINQLKFDK